MRNHISMCVTSRRAVCTLSTRVQYFPSHLAHDLNRTSPVRERKGKSLGRYARRSLKYRQRVV